MPTWSVPQSNLFLPFPCGCISLMTPGRTSVDHRPLSFAISFSLFSPLRGTSCTDRVCSANQVAHSGSWGQTLSFWSQKVHHTPHYPTPFSIVCLLWCKPRFSTNMNKLITFSIHGPRPSDGDAGPLMTRVQRINMKWLEMLDGVFFLSLVYDTHGHCKKGGGGVPDKLATADDRRTERTSTSNANENVAWFIRCRWRFLGGNTDTRSE